MTTPYEIPLSPKPQKFGIAIAGLTYTMTVRWNVPNASWIIDIADSSGIPLLSGIPMVTGSDLLEQFDYLNLGFSLVSQTDNAPNVVPTFENLGTTGHLFAIVDS